MPLAVDADDQAALATALRDVDAVVNALPYRYAAPVARVAAARHVHYFDLTEDVASTAAIRELDDGARAVLMPQCGLAPGLIGVIGHQLLDGFDEPRALKLRVGALPRYPVNALRYNLTWSTDGLINEYINPCEAIVDARRVTTAALEGYERLLIDGIEYEAFNTSGGLGTLAHTLSAPRAGRPALRQLDYKSLRYPGHHAIMRTLLGDLALADRRDLLKQILEHAVPHTQQDVVVMLACASGLRGGVLSERVWSRHLHGGVVAGMPMTAIQLTTAVGVCAALQCVREGGAPSRGFVSQEQIDATRLLGNRFGRLLDLRAAPAGHGRSGGSTPVGSAVLASGSPVFPAAGLPGVSDTPAEGAGAQYFGAGDDDGKLGGTRVDAMV